MLLFILKIQGFKLKVVKCQKKTNPNNNKKHVWGRYRIIIKFTIHLCFISTQFKTSGTVSKLHQYDNAIVIYSRWNIHSLIPLFVLIDWCTECFIKRAKSYNLFTNSILLLAYAALTAFTSTAKVISENNKVSYNYAFLKHWKICDHAFVLCSKKLFFSINVYNYVRLNFQGSLLVIWFNGISDMNYSFVRVAIILFFKWVSYVCNIHLKISFFRWRMIRIKILTLKNLGKCKKYRIYFVKYRNIRKKGSANVGLKNCHIFIHEVLI